MIVLDTTVLVYAVGGDHPFCSPCQRLVKAVAARQIDATTTPEVIQEFVHVRSRRRPREDAVRYGRRWIDLLAPLITVDERVLSRGLDGFADSTRIGAFDAVLAASADAAGASAVVSADRAFTAALGDRHVVPDIEGIAGLLGAEAE